MTKPTIFILTHKKYKFPALERYVPLEVGAVRRKDLELNGYRDDSGESISIKNPNYCELTGLYWVWKNYRGQEPIGFVHYRRYFGNPGWFASKDEPITTEALDRLLDGKDIVLPKIRNYYIESVRSQYEHAHHKQDLAVLRDSVEALTPQYLEAFDAVMSGTKLHLFNMFVMRRSLFDDYCAWLFAILSEVESKLDIWGYSDYDARVFGFLSERLLDVWIRKNGLSYVELPILKTEKENWPKKIANFLARKFLKAGK